MSICCDRQQSDSSATGLGHTHWPACTHWARLRLGNSGKGSGESEDELHSGVYEGSLGRRMDEGDEIR